MTVFGLDAYFRSFLDIDGIADSSVNGVQVDNGGSEIHKIAFAVDACMETFKRARQLSADMLFVHHGLFWGKDYPIFGGNRERVKFLLDNNIALYACHLPLDVHSVVGNNAVIADILGVAEREPFGVCENQALGIKGVFKTASHEGMSYTIDEIAKKLSWNASQPLAILPFGKQKNSTCAIISGGASRMVYDAINEGIDIFISGEANHEVYHHVMEGKINMLAAGHYATEVHGPRAVMQKCQTDLNVDCVFIDVNTAL
jgi:dinuclear metal center YbgI/SA1388 family protein